MKNVLFISALLMGHIISTAQNVVQAEYFLDTDAGFGNNTLIALPNPQPDGTYNLNINLGGVTPGYHKLYIRTKDNDGKWSLTSRRNIEVEASAVRRITGGEYFFDTLPRFKPAMPITIAPQDSVILQNFTAATTGLAVGHHKLYIRLKDNDGNWSLTARRNVEVIDEGAYVIAGAEYFFNTDPGVGSATRVTFSQPLADGSFTFNIPLSAIPADSNTLYIRASDSGYRHWSHTQWKSRDSVSIVTTLQSGLWSQPATWSNNRVPDSNTVVLLLHNVEVDITDAVCKSLTPYGSNVQCIVDAGKALRITGHK